MESIGAVITEEIRSLLCSLDDATIQSLWRVTEVGMREEDDADVWQIESLRQDVEMEIWQQLLDMACYEATGKWPNQSTSNSDDQWD